MSHCTSSSSRKTRSTSRASTNRQIVVEVQVDGRNVVVGTKAQRLELVRLIENSIFLQRFLHVQNPGIVVVPLPRVATCMGVCKEVPGDKNIVQRFLGADLERDLVAVDRVDNPELARLARELPNHILGILPPRKLVVRVDLGVGQERRNVDEAAKRLSIRLHPGHGVDATLQVAGIAVKPVRDVCPCDADERQDEVGLDASIFLYQLGEIQNDTVR